MNQTTTRSLFGLRLPSLFGPRTAPTIFHVTHWKAGSQWLYKILQGCRPDLIVAPQIRMAQIHDQPIRAGGVYPTIYFTREEFLAIKRPRNSRHFVVIRDLRDTLISLYFSVKVSHPIMGDAIEGLRAALNRMSVEDGLREMMRDPLPYSAKIQESWLASGEPLLRYEDLLIRDIELLEKVLIDQCGLPVEREKFREVVASNRFESLTGGRARGTEDVKAHERKGVAGDWKGYFTDKLKAEFKAKFGEILIATKYEKDLKW